MLEQEIKNLPNVKLKLLKEELIQKYEIQKDKIQLALDDLLIKENQLIKLEEEFSIVVKILAERNVQ